jgi:hypothetical protein
MFQHELIKRCDSKEEDRKRQSFCSIGRKKNSKPDPAECLIGELRYRIKVSGRDRVLFTPLYCAGAPRLLKALGCSNNLPRTIENWNRSHHHRDAVTVAVMQVKMTLSVLSIADGHLQWAGTGTNHPALLVAMNKNLITTAAPHHLVAQITADSFCPCVPKDDPSFRVD